MLSSCREGKWWMRLEAPQLLRMLTLTLASTPPPQHCDDADRQAKATLDQATREGLAGFKSRFESVFNLTGKGYGGRAFTPQELEAAQAAFSNLIGGVGSFHGRAVIKGPDGHVLEVRGKGLSLDSDMPPNWQLLRLLDLEPGPCDVHSKTSHHLGRVQALLQSFHNLTPDLPTHPNPTPPPR